VPCWMLLAAPRRCITPTHSGAGTRDNGDAQARWRNGKALALVAIPVLMVLGQRACGSSGMVSGRASAGDRLGFAARDWVLIARFENRTGEPLLDGTLEYALAASSVTLGFVNVVPARTVEDVLRLNEAAARHAAPISPWPERVCLRDGDIPRARDRPAWRSSARATC